MTLSMRWPSHGTAKVLVVVGSISRQLHWPQGKYLAALQGVFRVFSVRCEMCFFPIFLWKWRNGHVVNQIINHPQHPFFWIEIIPSHGRFMSLGESCIMFWNSLTAKNSFLIAMCCKKKTRCWPSFSSTVGADESNWAHANGIALIRLVVTPIPS